MAARYESAKPTIKEVWAIGQPIMINGIENIRTAVANLPIKLISILLPVFMKMNWPDTINTRSLAKSNAAAQSGGVCLRTTIAITTDDMKILSTNGSKIFPNADSWSWLLAK